jgi:hypothetical protein
MVDLSEAYTLCSKSELILIECSFTPMLDTITPSNLKLKIDGVKKLHGQCTKMIDLLHSEERVATTRRKITLFAETIGRLQATLDNSENRIGTPAVKHDGGKTVMEIPPPGLIPPPEQDERKPESHDRRIPSALARRGEERVSKSGSMRGQSRVGSTPRRQQGRRNSSKNH